MTREEENEVVRAVLHGETDEFEKLVAAYEKPVYHIAFKMTGNEEDAFDLSQDTFLKAYRSLNTFRGESSFGTWICRMAANLCIDFLRKQKKHGKVLSLDDTNEDGRPVELPDLRFEPQSAMEKRELSMQIREGLGKLPPEQKLILILRDMEGFSYQEIADILKMELGTVKSRIYRARAHLAKLLTETGNFFGFSSSKDKERR